MIDMFLYLVWQMSWRTFLSASNFLPFLSFESFRFVGLILALSIRAEACALDWFQSERRDCMSTTSAPGAESISIEFFQHWNLKTENPEVSSTTISYLNVLRESSIPAAADFSQGSEVAWSLQEICIRFYSLKGKRVRGAYVDFSVKFSAQICKNYAGVSGYLWVSLTRARIQLHDHSVIWRGVWPSFSVLFETTFAVLELKLDLNHMF